MTQIFQNSLLPTFAIDNNHLVTHWNRACESVTGISAAEMIGTSEQWRPFYQLKKPLPADFIVARASRKEIVSHFGSTIQPSPLVDGAYQGRCVLAGCKEKKRYLFFTAVPITDEQGQVIGAMQTLQDTVTMENYGDACNTSGEKSDKQTRQSVDELSAENVDLKSQVEECRRVIEELQRSENTCSIVANFTYDWEYWIAPGGSLVYTSPSVERVTGYSPEEFQKTKDLLVTLVHSGDREVFCQHLENELMADGVFHLDFRITTRSGEERWISHFCQPVFDSEGKHLGRRASNRDVTRRKELEVTIREERKELERRVQQRSRQLSSAFDSLQEEMEERKSAYQALLESEEELRKRKEFIETILDNLPIGLAVYTISDGVVHYMNAEFITMHGWPENALGSFDAFFDHVYPDPKYRRVIKKRVTKDIATGNPAKMIWNNVLPVTQNGEKRVLIAANIPLFEQDLMIVTTRDVTEKYKANQALQFTRFSIDHANDLVYWLGPDGNIVDVNETTCQKLGYARDELLSMTLMDINPNLPPEQFHKNWEHVKKHGTLRAEAAHHCRNGDVIPVETHFDYIAFGRNEYICVFARDVTERRELERLISIQDKMGSLGRVAAGIAHEIRNPLSTINVYLSTLKRLLAADDFDLENLTSMEDTITEMDSASRKIEAVVRRVMDFSKPSKQRKHLANVNQCVRDAVGLSLVTLRKSGITMDVDLDETLPECYMDYQLIEQLVLNLITNAREELVEYQGEKKLKITTSLNNSYSGEKSIAITVADSGPGVSAELRDKVFDPFFTTKQYGSGIGLSICHRIISDHNGFLHIATSKWGGAVFTAEFPLKDKEMA